MQDPAKVSEEVATVRQRYPLDYFVAINPEYSPRGSDLRGFYEGCLSMPNYVGVVNRPLSVDAVYATPEGKKQNIDLTGWSARIFQHETDHLKGIVYVDRMETRSLSTSQNYLNRWDEPAPKRAASSLNFPLK
jgi:peptide deformylase